jgi:hypothetical protein
MTALNIPVISNKATPTEIQRAFNAIKMWSVFMERNGYPSNGTVVGGSGDAAGDTPGTLPGIVTGFVAQGAFNTIILQYDPGNHVGYTEIWRAEVDNLGIAVYIGSTTASIYGDTPPDSSLAQDYYYWARHVNDAGPGAFNSTHGTKARTADEPEYVLQLLLDSKWKAGISRALNFIGYPRTPNGYAYKVTVAGTSGTVEPNWPTTIGQTVTDGTITWRCEAVVPLVPPFELGYVNGIITTVIKTLMIGDATITNAMIKSLAADKIVASALSAVSANLGTIISGQINFGSFTGYAWPASGTGAHLSPAGLLLGNPNTGQYFQLTAAGQLFAPGFTISGGNATFAGTLAGKIVRAANIFAETITVAEIWGLARINGNRLDVVASGALAIGFGQSVTITHNLGRTVIITLFNNATDSFNVKISAQTVNSFTLKEIGGSNGTIYYAYI